MKKLNNTYRLLRTLVVMFVLGASIPAKAELTCPDAGLLSGKLLTDVCWSCIFLSELRGFLLALAVSQAAHQTSHFAYVKIT